MTCRWLQSSGLWAVPSSQEEQKGSGSCRSLQHRRTWTIPWLPASCRAQGSAFPVQRHQQWHRSGQDMNSFALFHMTAHSSEGLYSSNCGRSYRTVTKPIPTIPVWMLGKGSTGKTSWPVHNQTMLVTCVGALWEPWNPCCSFLHAVNPHPNQGGTPWAGTGCTEDISCDLDKKGFWKS